MADPASGAWIKAQGVDGDTALHLACLYGRGELVPILLSKV
jgi:ankyrin repeat protein